LYPPESQQCLQFGDLQIYCPKHQKYRAYTCNTYAKNGRKIKEATIKNYYYLYKLLINFQAATKFTIRTQDTSKLSKRELAAEKIYWNKFYKKFTDYLYSTN
jgi:thioredoxin-related protein